MAAIIVVGVGWRRYLGAEAAGRARGHLAGAVYQLFLPALVLQVLWQAPVDGNTVRVPLVAAVSVLCSLLLAWLIYGLGRRWFAARADRAAVGALLLASGFGNFSYLGIPVLSQSFGAWARVVAIQFDLLASTPLLFSVGVLLARHYGGEGGGDGAGSGVHPLSALARVPAIWAALAGLGCSAFGLPQPEWLHLALTTLGAAVVPLMLLSVGMALRWQSGWRARVPLLLPALAIQLLWMPLVAWGAASLFGVDARLLPPSVIEAAMPTMVLGLVICDRFRLDASLYAEAVSLSTALSLLSLSLWMVWVA